MVKTEWTKFKASTSLWARSRAPAHHVPPVVEGDGEVGDGVDILGGEPNGLVIGVNGLIVPAGSAEGDAKVVVVGWFDGVNGNCAGDGVDSRVMPAVLMFNDAKEVDRVGVNEVGVENAAVKCLVVSYAD